MVLLSVHGLPAAQIARLLECHPATVRRWIGRFNREGTAGLADRPRSGRPRLAGRRLARRVAALLERPGPWTLPRSGPGAATATARLRSHGSKQFLVPPAPRSSGWRLA
jgi:hypothetical protein